MAGTCRVGELRSRIHALKYPSTAGLHVADGFVAVKTCPSAPRHTVICCLQWEQERDSLTHCLELIDAERQLLRSAVELGDVAANPMTPPSKGRPAGPPQDPPVGVDSPQATGLDLQDDAASLGCAEEGLSETPQKPVLSSPEERQPEDAACALHPDTDPSMVHTVRLFHT